MELKQIDCDVDAVALTASLMAWAQETQQPGSDKKQLVIDAFGQIGPQDAKGIQFKKDILPVLIDVLKLTARGAYHLVVETKCCGAF